MTALEKFKTRRGLDDNGLTSAFGLGGATVDKLRTFALAAVMAGTVLTASGIDASAASRNKVSVLNHSNLEYAQLIEARADKQLEQINLLRQVLTASKIWLDPNVDATKKSDTINDVVKKALAPDPAMVAEGLNGETIDPAQYDDMVFELAKTLPSTGVLKDQVDTLNYKRMMVKTAVDAVRDVQVSFFSNDPNQIRQSITKLEGVMLDFDLAISMAMQNQPGIGEDPQASEEEPNDPGTEEIPDETSFDIKRRYNISDSIERLREASQTSDATLSI